MGSPIEYTVLEVDPPSKPGNARVNYPEIDEIARTFPPQENTLRLFFVADILITVPGSKLHVLGISFDAGEKLRPSTTLGSSFVRLGRDPYTAAHELGHLLMPKDKREGHYGQRADIGIPGARHVQSINLLGVTAMGDQQHAQHSKRIWDLKDADGQDQIGDLYKSVYLR